VADVGHEATTAADGMAGSTTQRAMRLVGEHMTQQANAMSKNVADRTPKPRSLAR
jgi:hypothetical protein